MPDTGAPWNITYVAGTDLVADWPTDNQTMAESIADALDIASVLKQTAGAFKSTSFSTTSTSYVDVTDLTVTITPSSATSKVLVIAHGFTTNTNNGGGEVDSRLMRDATALVDPFARTIHGGGDETSGSVMVAYLDSPATTSATTYKVQIKANGNTAYWGRNVTDSTAIESGIIVAEVTA